MSKKKLKSKRTNLLTSPGSLTYVGPEVGLKAVIKQIEYNTSFCEEKTIKHGDVRPPRESNGNDFVTWLNVDGIHEPDLMANIGHAYKLHPLILEDIMNTAEKPKLEDYEDEFLFLTLKMLRMEEATGPEIISEHISFTLGKNWLLSFQEEYQGDIFSSVSNRLSASVGKTRRNGADYLLFALIDVVVDNYFLVLENFGERVDQIEDDVIAGTQKRSLRDLYNLKRELTATRRVIWPLREMIGQLVRVEHPLIGKDALPYFRDLYDHVVQALETVESYRELLASLVDVYLSTISNRMNEVMKVLTIFSAIFMPITFVVGVYGMNFQYMPELSEPNGYLITWIVMIAIIIGMLIYFRWKKWI